MIRKILGLFGYEIVYVHEWGEWKTCYSQADHAMSRPVHKNMSVAPPGSRMEIRKIAS